jgi:hypothetical protein
MTRHHRREDWDARPAEARYRLDPLKVEGVALHWPGMEAPLTTDAQVAAALHGWQRQHMDTDQLAPGGASDIAYQVAIDNRGAWWQCRGLRYRSGANGDMDVNERFGAFLLVLGPREAPTKAMCDTVRERIARFRDMFPNARRIVGHQDIRPEPTSCPGVIVETLIHAGHFNPQGAR